MLGCWLVVLFNLVLVCILKDVVIWYSDRLLIINYYPNCHWCWSCGQWRHMVLFNLVVFCLLIVVFVIHFLLIDKWMVCNFASLIFVPRAYLTTQIKNPSNYLNPFAMLSCFLSKSYICSIQYCHLLSWMATQTHTHLGFIVQALQLNIFFISIDSELKHDWFTCNISPRVL